MEPAGGTTRRRGPVPAHSRADIAWAAIAIADDDGIDAVTMRRVARQLGTGAMSLYRYVDSKDALYDVMIDEMLGYMVAGQESDVHERFSGDWRTDLRMIAHGNRQLQLRHPWFPKLTAIRPVAGPNMLAVVESGMSTLDGLGLEIDDMMEICNLVIHWVTGFVQDELGGLQTQQRTGLSEAELQRDTAGHLSEALTAEEHPYVHRIMREGKPRTADERFDRALDWLIAGFEASIPRRQNT